MRKHTKAVAAGQAPIEIPFTLEEEAERDSEEQAEAARQNAPEMIRRRMQGDSQYPSFHDFMEAVIEDAEGSPAKMTALVSRFKNLKTQYGL